MDDNKELLEDSRQGEALVMGVEKKNSNGKKFRLQIYSFLLSAMRKLPFKVANIERHLVAILYC